MDSAGRYSCKGADRLELCGCTWYNQRRMVELIVVVRVHGRGLGGSWELHC